MTELRGCHYVYFSYPLRARRFAEGAGFLAKTDRVDALMLARLGAVLVDLEPVAPRDAFLSRSRIFW